MKFVEKFALEIRGPSSQEESRKVEGTLLIGDEIVAEWYEAVDSYGGDECWLTPAYFNGERCFVLSRSWSPARGYCTYGTEETILDLEKGIRLAIEHGQWSVFGRLKD